MKNAIELEQRGYDGGGKAKYVIMLHGKYWGEVYFNLRGYNGYIPVPSSTGSGIASLNIGKEKPIATFKREIAKANREWSRHGGASARFNPRQRAPVHCPACGGEGRELGSLGYLRHFNCRDCGAQFSKKARIRRKKLSKNPAYRTRASTKKIIGAWLRARGGKGALKLGRLAARRMGIGMSKSGNWVTKRKPSRRSKK